MSAPACTAVCGREWMICSGPSEPGAAHRLTQRASSAMSCSHSPSPGAGRTFAPMLWSLDGWRQRWAGLQLRTICNKGASPRHGSPPATTSWRDRRAGISIISALERRARSPTMARPKNSCWPSATASPAFLFCETGRPGALWQWVISMRVPLPVSVAHSAITRRACSHRGTWMIE